MAYAVRTQPLVHPLPGDIIVGDDDGLLAIRPADAPELLELARKKAADEQRTKSAIAEGRLDRSWVREALSARSAAVS